jgi:nucleoside-diphosphate-sugar epimerase
MQWTHVDDLADALVLAGTRPDAAGRTYNVAGAELHTRDDVARALRVVHAREPWPAVLPSRPGPLLYDIARAREELEWSPRVRLADGLGALAAGARTGWA